MILTHSFTYCLALLSRYTYSLPKTPLNYYLHHSLVNPQSRLCASVHSIYAMHTCLYLYWNYFLVCMLLSPASNPFRLCSCFVCCLFVFNLFTSRYHPSISLNQCSIVSVKLNWMNNLMKEGMVFMSLRS